MKCHMCGGETEWYCAQCGEPVCEDCCVVPTYMNQIEETRCKDCETDIESRRWEENHREHVKEEKIKEEKAARAKKRHETYWKPENVEKRRLAKVERKKAAADAAKKRLEETFKAVNSMFKGMF